MVASIRTAVIILLSALSLPVEASPTCLALSNGSETRLAEYNDGVLQLNAPLFKTSNMRNVVWPSYDKVTGSLFFEAWQNLESLGIYQANAADGFKTPELLVRGRYPALSPDGSMLAYLSDASRNEERVLTIRNISSGVDTLVGKVYKGFSLWRRPLWLNNKELIYIEKNDEVFVFNRINGTRSKLFEEKLFAVASRNGVMLFTSHDALSLFKYEAGELKLIFKHRFLRIGPGIVLLSDGSGFLYTRQTWAKQLRLSEVQTLFYYAFRDGSEKELIDYSLFGGTLLPCPTPVER